MYYIFDMRCCTMIVLICKIYETIFMLLGFYLDVLLSSLCLSSVKLSDETDKGLHASLVFVCHRFMH